MYPYQQPDPTGHFGTYGGSFVSETLTHAISELRDAYAKYQHEPAFRAEFESELKHFVGRPSPVYHAERMSREQGGAQIVAVATPCWPAPVSAMMRGLPMRRASIAWPITLLILWAPVWFRSSRFR